MTSSAPLHFPLPITFVLPDLGGGGAQKVMLTIAGGLDRTRFAPRVLVVGGSQAFAEHLPAGVPAEIGRAPRLRDGLPWLLRRLRAEPPSAVVSVMGYLNLSLLAVRRLLPSGTRLVIREANAVQATAESLPSWLPGQFLYRRLYPRADFIVSPTAEISDALGALAPRTDGRRVVIVNPVDVAGLRQRAEAPRREPGEGVRLVAVGRLTRQKGYDRLLPLLATLPPTARLTIFGKGEDQDMLTAQADSLGLGDRVRLAGFTHEVPRWIAGADALVLPSRWEGLPNVVLEALALGTPAVVSDQASAAGIAAEASVGAVTIRSVDAAFASALAGVSVLPGIDGSSPALRPSLLPTGYWVESVVARWNSLLTGLTASAH
ncbi:MAG: glycosyltransferase [Hyphomicrobium sp.]